MEFHLHEIDHDVLILSADGGINAQTAQQFVDDLAKIIDSGVRKIIVDLSHVDYLSSYGLSVLLRVHAKLKRHGGDVKLAHLKGIVAELLQITHLDSLFEIYPDVDRARLAFRPRQ